MNCSVGGASNFAVVVLVVGLAPAVDPAEAQGGVEGFGRRDRRPSPEPFLATFTQTPVFRPWWSASHDSHRAASAKATMSAPSGASMRSSFLVVSRVRRRSWARERHGTRGPG